MCTVATPKEWSKQLIIMELDINNIVHGMGYPITLVATVITRNYISRHRAVSTSEYCMYY